MAIARGQITITEQYDGYTIILSKETIVIPCTSLGTPLAGELGANGRATVSVKVLKGGVPLTAVAFNTAVKEGQFRCPVNTISGCSTTRVDNSTMAISSVSADSGKFVFDIYLEGASNMIQREVSFAKSKQGETGEMLAGKVLFNDPEFKKGVNSLVKYTRADYTNNISLERVESPSDCPTTSSYCVKITATGSNGNIGFGGFYQIFQSRPNAVFIQKVIAKLPIGYKLMTISNSMGTGFKREWLTPAEGTGEYEVYMVRITCGSTGTFSTGGFLYVTGSPIPTEEAPLEWYIAYATSFDLSAGEYEELSAIAKTIIGYKNQINETYKTVSALYGEVYNNALLSGIPKSNLLAKKEAFELAHTVLQDTITSVTNDGITTATEKTTVDSKYTLLNDSLANFNRALEVAKQAISNMQAQDKVDKVQIGGTNLISNLEYNWKIGSLNELSATGTTWEGMFYKSTKYIRIIKEIAVSSNIAVSIDTTYRYCIAQLDGEGKYLGKATYIGGHTGINYHVLNEATKFIGIIVGFEDSKDIVPADIVYSRLKIENGNKATDWSPSPDDQLVRVGGKNLLPYSDFSGTKKYNPSETGIYTTSIEDGMLKIVGTEVGDGNSGKRINLPSLEANKTDYYVLSFDAYALEPTTISFRPGYSNLGTYGGSVPVGTTKQRYSKVFMNFGYNDTYNLLLLWFDKATTLYLDNMKLERGTSATDWTPAPKDIEDDILAANNKAAQAITDAKKANDTLTSWKADGVISPLEKQAIKETQTAILTEKNEIVAEAAKYSVSSSAYVTAWANYNTQLTNHSKATPENITISASLATTQTAYSTAKVLIRQAIADAIRAYADTVSNDAVNNIQIGMVNLLKESNVALNAQAYRLGNYYFDKKLEVGKEYTFVTCYTLGANNASVDVYQDSGYASLGVFKKQGNKVIESRTFNYSSTRADDYIGIYQSPKGTYGGSIIHWAVLVEGNKAPNGWIPALSEQGQEAAKDAVDNLQIGSVNLLPISKLNPVSYKSDSSKEGSGSEIIFKCNTPNAWAILPVSIPTPVVPTNTDFIISMDIRSTNGFGFEVTATSGTPTIFGKINFENTTSTWKRISKQYNSGDKSNIGGINLWGVGDVRHIKIEIGNKATDWSPAPEDIQAEIQIGGENLLLNGDLRYYSDGYNPGWDTELNGNLKSTRGWSAGYNSGVNTPAIGYHAHMDVSKFGFPVLAYMNTNNRWLGISQSFSEIKRKKLLPGQQYTISFDMYSETLNGQIHGGISHTKIGATSSSWGTTYYRVYADEINKWKRYSATFTLNADIDLSKSATFYIYGQDGVIGNKWVKNISLQLGTKGSFSRSPEDTEFDLQTSIQETETWVDAAKNKIASQLGFPNYSSFASSTALGKTLITGGKINTELIEAKAVVAEGIMATHINGLTLDIKQGKLGGWNVDDNNFYSSNGLSYNAGRVNISLANITKVGDSALATNAGYIQGLNIAGFKSPYGFRLGIGQICDSAWYNTTPKANCYGIEFLTGNNSSGSWVTKRIFRLSANSVTGESDCSIAGWKIDAEQLYSTNKTCWLKPNRLVLYKEAQTSASASAARVMMYYNSASDYGLYGHNGTSVVFQIGSTNKIAGWSLDASKLYSGKLQLTSAGSISQTDNKWALNNDGSGRLAGGNIVWDAAGTVTFGSSVKLQWQNDIEIAKSTNYGYRYSKTITLNGEHDKYYPVIIKSGDQTVKRDILIKRNYSELHPPEWNTSTHGGGLTLLLKTNFGGWGGANYSWEIHALEEMYNNTFCGATTCMSYMAFAIFLRGGGTTGATYHIFSNQPIDTAMYNIAGCQICYNSDLIGQTGDYSWNAPAPRTRSAADIEEMQQRLIPKNAQNSYLELRDHPLTKIDANGVYTGTLTASQINAGTLSADRIGAGSITAAKLATNSVTADKIAASAITAVKIAANAVTTEKILAGNITAVKLAANAVTAEKISANAVTSVKIAAKAITADKIAVNAVTADKISVTDLSAIGATIGGFTIDTNTLYSGDKFGTGSYTGICIQNLSTDRKFSVYKGNGNEVKMYQDSGGYGITALQGGNTVFQLGSVNKIGGWNFDGTSFYSGNTKPTITDGLTNSGMVLGADGSIAAPAFCLKNDGGGKIGPFEITKTYLSSELVSGSDRWYLRMRTSGISFGKNESSIGGTGIHMGPGAGGISRSVLFINGGDFYHQAGTFYTSDVQMRGDMTCRSSSTLNIEGNMINRVESHYMSGSNPGITLNGGANIRNLYGTGNRKKVNIMPGLAVGTWYIIMSENGEGYDVLTGGSERFKRNNKTFQAAQSSGQDTVFVVKVSTSVWIAAQMPINWLGTWGS